MREMQEILKNPNLFNKEKFLFGYAGMVHLPDVGGCSVVFSDKEEGWEHVSIAPRHKNKIPTWEDMCFVKDIFWSEEEEVYQIHPKKSTYVNIKENCLHLWKPVGHELGELVKEG